MPSSKCEESLAGRSQFDSDHGVVTRKFGNVERNSHCDVLHITPISVARLFLDCNGVFAIKAYDEGNFVKLLKNGKAGLKNKLSFNPFYVPGTQIIVTMATENFF